MMRAATACLAVGLAGCAPGAARPELPGGGAKEAGAGREAKREERPMPGAVSPAGDKHPGQIVYDDRVEDRTWTEDAADVPATIAWGKVHDHWKPVVRIEITGAGDQREMAAFGPSHELLQTTTARLSGPAPSEPAPVPTPTPTPTPTPK